MNELQEYIEELKVLKQRSNKLIEYLEDKSYYKQEGVFICNCDYILGNNLKCQYCKKEGVNSHLCIICSEPIYSYRKYCSPECCYKNKRTTQPCYFCGYEIDIPKRDANKKHFCTKECYVSYRIDLHKRKKLSTC